MTVVREDVLLRRCVVVACQCLCVAFFFFLFELNPFLSHQQLSFENLTELKVEQIAQEPKEVIARDSGVWRQGPVFRQMSLSRIALPTDVDLEGQSLFFSGYRHHVEVSLDDRLLISAGRKKLQWTHIYSPALTVPLSLTEQQRSSEWSNPLYVTVKATAQGGTHAQIAQVWIGPDRAVENAAERLALSKVYLPYATLGLLLGLIVFLVIDAPMSTVSRKYFYLTLPHLAFAFACLPEPDFVDSILWAKVFILSVIATALFWSQFVLIESGLKNRFLNWLVALNVVMAIPYFFLDDPYTLLNWALNYHVVATFIAGILHFFYLGWMRYESADKLKNNILILAGGFLIGAAFSDMDVSGNPTDSMKDGVFPIVSLVMTLLILVVTAINMRRRGQQLLHHQNNMRELVKLRTQALEDTQSTLLQHQRFKTLNAMGSAISHEIKNPLAALQNDFHLIMLKQKKKQQKDEYPLERISRNISRIDHTLTELTNYSKKLPLDRQAQNLSSWLKDFHEEENLNCARPSVVFDFMVKEGVVTRFDADSLRRVLLNLIDNAVNASDKDAELQVSLSLHSTDHMIDLVVEDSGPGFDESNIDSICEPLVSGGATGLGLGLAIVSDIVRLHGGELILGKSEALGGASVTMRLPVTEL